MKQFYPTAEDWYQHRYEECVKRLGKDSPAAQMYADKLKRMSDGPKSVAEAFNKRPMD